VAERKAFLLRVAPELLEALQRWADDDLRSLNGQIEFLLRRALADAGRSDGAQRAPARTERSRPPTAEPVVKGSRSATKDAPFVKKPPKGD
jgi:hypothetical protein